MDLLISAKAVQRLGPRLVENTAGHRLLCLGDDGKVRLDDVALAEAEINPQVAWFSQDVLRQGHSERFFDLLESRRSIRLIQTLHAGLDHPRYGAVLAGEMRICNSNAQAPAIAEYILANVLALFQSLDQQRALQAAAQWRGLGFREICGSRWLIIGLGNIGLETARRVKAFGAEVIGVKRSPLRNAGVDRVVRPEQMTEYLRGADVVVLSCPLTPETADLVDPDFIAAMKKHSVLVNIGRGGLIDDQALLAGLQRDQPGHAVLDVFRTEPLPADDPYWGHEKVRLTAHSSNAGSGTVARGDELFFENLRRYCAGEDLLNEVLRAI